MLYVHELNNIFNKTLFNLGTLKILSNCVKYILNEVGVGAIRQLPRQKGRHVGSQNMFRSSGKSPFVSNLSFLH
jgi:hypothetical protein